MREFWFKPKTHGYGAYPTGWKGWALIAGVGVANLVLMGVILLLPLLSGAVPGLGRFILFIVLETLLVIWFLIMVKRRTDGEWGWRWGRD